MEWFGDIFDQLWRTWAYLTTGRVLATVLGIGFALLAVTLWIASRTKWGQSKPLTKCVVVSVLLHVWLLMYAIGSPKILPQGSLDGTEQNISVSFERASAPEPAVPETSTADQQPPMAATTDGNDPGGAVDGPVEPWEMSVPVDQLPKPPQLESFDLSSTLAPALLPALEVSPMPSLPPPEPLASLEQSESTSAESTSHDSSSEHTSPWPLEAASAAIAPSSSAAQLPETQAMQTVAGRESGQQNQLAPYQSVASEEYSLRQDPNRLARSQAFGADADSEAAVEAALGWLAKAQSPDGSWNAAQYGAGEERYVLGETRHGTGAKADTGVSGLALLAFLSGGHTHLQGEYQSNVESGLRYLLRAQMPSGDLSGPKQVGNDWSVLNARMYCHSIATLALAEAYAMTHDAAIRDALLRAVQYSVNAQDVRGGGWRYKPRDAGDLSQFGWQAMALRSVERSGIRIPLEVKRRMRRFLDSCAAGNYGGLATYQPRQGRPSDTMTAEALACRLLLDYPLSLAAQREATGMIMSHHPGINQAADERSAAQDGNVYYWYYATLALFQLQDENWRVWNQALKARLLATQVPNYGREPGSWKPDTLWAGYGGRVYSTAMSCLCLEVYYRYLPLYQRSNLARQPNRPRPGYRR